MTLIHTHDAETAYDGTCKNCIHIGMTQTAPFPKPLRDLVRALVYKPNWDVSLTQHDRGQGSEGLTLIITTCTTDSYNPINTRYRVNHYFPVPPAAYDRRSWQRWLLDCYLAVESHEACEFFQVDGARPYAPSHGPGNDPYLIREIGTELDARTAFTGVVNA